MSLLDVEAGLDDGPCLHDGDLGICDVEAAAAVTHHGVELVQAVDNSLELGDLHVHLLGQSYDVLFLCGNELVERGIEEADGDGMAVHGFIDALEVALLHGLELGKSLLALLGCLGNDHLADSGDTIGIKEHVLCTAEADALGAEVIGVGGVGGGIGVGADAQLADVVGPAHEASEVAADGGIDRGDGFAVDVACRAVEGDPVALCIGPAGKGELLVLLIHDDLAAARYAACTHAAGDDGGVRGHAAADGQNALGVMHALDVLRRGLETNENDLLALLGPLCGIFGRKYDPAAGGAGGGGQGCGDRCGLLYGFGVELGMEQSVKALGVDHGDGFFLCDHAFVNKVAGDLDGGGGSSLAVSCLEHIELLVLDGELHILHVAVVLFQPAADIDELLICLGHYLGQLVDGLGCADAGDDVFALGVHKELAEELLLAGGGVTGEGNACARCIAHVAEYHHLDVDGRAPAAGDVVHPAVVVGPGVLPAAENGLDGAHQLLLGILGELFADLGLILGLELVSQLFEILGRKLCIELDAALLLHLVDEGLEVLLADLHDDVGIHLDEPAVRVICKAGIVGLLCKSLDNDVVEAEVQDGVHHAGHRSSCARTDRDQKGVLDIAELLAGDTFQLGDILHDLGLDLVVDRLAVGIILCAGFGGDGKALGNGHAEVGHLGQIGALAAQKLSHFAVAFRKQIDKLAHSVAPLYQNYKYPVSRRTSAVKAAYTDAL